MKRLSLRGLLWMLLLVSAALSCGGGGESGGKGNLKGTIKDISGTGVGDAQLTATDVSSSAVLGTAKASYSGDYELKDLPAGLVNLSASADWFATKSAQATVPGTLDLQLEEMPLKIDTADQQLVDTYNSQTTDWTMATLYMAVAPAPTRRYLDNAIYFHNPALFHDTSAAPPVTPSPQPTIGPGGASGFDFPVGGAGGDQAFTTIVDKFAETGLPAERADDFLLWTPMVNWLSESKRNLDTATLNKVRAVGSAVTLQNWGGNTAKPQQIENVYLNNGELWVKIVFEPFVQLGAGITDDNGNGRKKVFAKVDPKHVPASIAELLQSQYVTTRLGTLGLKAELSQALNELYSSTNLQIVKTIGQPYEISGQGTIKYPFVVHEQSGPKGKVKGVLLVAP